MRNVLSRRKKDDGENGAFRASGSAQWKVEWPYGNKPPSWKEWLIILGIVGMTTVAVTTAIVNAIVRSLEWLKWWLN